MALQECLGCNEINCTNCSLSFRKKSLGIAPIVVAAIIGAVVTTGATVYSVESQKAAAKKQRAWAEEQARLAEQEAQQEAFRIQQQQAASQAQLVAQQSYGTSLISGIPQEYMILGGALFMGLLLIMVMR